MALKREPHPGTPFKQLTDEQRFDRLVFHRRESALARSQERKYGDAHRDHLPPGLTVDAAGVVRHDDEHQQNELWREAVRMYYASCGEVILDRLPPDTTVDPATGEVTVDPDKQAW